MRLLVLYAMHREIGKAARLLGRRTRLPGLPFRAFRFRHPAHTVLAAETGVGVESAGRVFLRIIEAEKVDAAVSLGYCGALSPDADIGDLVWASRVCLVRNGRLEVLPMSDPDKLLEVVSGSLPIRPGTFFTLAGPMKKREIAPLVPAGTPLPVCDMETFALAQHSAAAGLPFFAVRSVSDRYDEDIAFDPRAVCDRFGTYRPHLAIRLLLSRPGLLPAALRLSKGSRIASRSLAQALDALLRAL
jgi:adenosylhomocysteine nucleosidase